MNHLNKMHLLDEVNDFVQTRIDISAIVTYRTDTNLCPLPQIIVSNLGDSHIKPVSYPIGQLPDDMPFPFEGMVLRNPKVELADSDYHFTPLPFEQPPPVNCHQ
jgi:hypothetical protein